MSVIGRVGQSWAAAGPLIAITIAAAAIIILRMLVSLSRRTFAPGADAIKASILRNLADRIAA